MFRLLVLAALIGRLHESLVEDRVNLFLILLNRFQLASVPSEFRLKIAVADLWLLIKGL